MSYYFDRFETNPIAAADYEESHSAQRRMSEVERVVHADSHRAAIGVTGEATDDL